MKPGPSPNTTWLAFAVEFGFASPAHGHVADLFFDQVVRRMVAAFEGRCAALYGPSALERMRRRREEEEA
jgi:ribosome-associated toxin RatA of RatAB toxin-antitoxin module